MFHHRLKSLQIIASDDLLLKIILFVYLENY